MEELDDIKRLSTQLAVKESTIRAWVFQQKIPFIRVGRLIRFSPSEITKWLRKQN